MAPPWQAPGACALLALLAAAGVARPARADEPVSSAAGTPPPASAFLEDKVDLMHLLAQKGLHDLLNERINLYSQATFIGSYHPSFQAPYTNVGGGPHSLVPTPEGSFTGTVTFFAGAALWPGGEAYAVPEVISELPFSTLAGLGSTIQNGELQKTGAVVPTLYMSRAYLRQTIGFGGARVEKKSDATQLGGTVDARRLVLTLGKLSILDVMDKNTYAGDCRRQWLSMAFLTHAAYDFAADARGYTWGAFAELYLDDWALRYAHVTVPKEPNQLAIDFRFWDYFGDQVEVEHAHRIFGRPGVVRLLGYRNRENMGRFDDALAAFRADPAKNAAACTAANYGSLNGSAPDLCWVRKPNVKMGVGINLEQQITPDVGAFFQGMYADGQTEVYAFTATDRSLSFGVLAKGTGWRRPTDSVGAAFGAGWISSQHAAYLAAGGVDGFIGDGRIRQATETTIELFYSVNPVKSLWLTADYQHVTNPAYNADRGPVEILGGRVHAEF